MSWMQDLVDQEKWNRGEAIVERYIILTILPLIIVSQVVFFVVATYIPMPPAIVDAGKTWMWGFVAANLALVGRRSVFHLVQAVPEHRWRGILLFGAGASFYVLFSCMGILNQSDVAYGLSPRFLLPSWMSVCFLLATDALSVFIWKWYVSKAAICDVLPPVPLTTVVVPIEQWTQYEQLKSDTAREHERLRDENLLLQKHLDGYRLIEMPVRDVDALLRRSICLMCQKGPIANVRHSVCTSCKNRYHNYISQIDHQRYRASSKGLPATLTLYQWLEKLDYYGRRCSYCQRNPAQVIEHYIPIAKGGGTTAENCDPACHVCNSEKSDRHPERVKVR